MNTPAGVRCYALRRLNPFLGLTQVLETPAGRASSTNGVVWEVQLLLPEAASWGSLGNRSGEKAWYRYGLWSEREGLVHRPLAAHNNGQQMATDSKAIIDELRAHLDQLPFPLADHRELWLLDSEQQTPLALLYAMQPGTQPPRPEPRYWSGCLGQQGVAGQLRFPEITKLETQIRKRAGFNIQRRWITWDAEHVSIIEGGDKFTRDTLFPAFGICQDWPDAVDQERAQRYIDWTAPALLTLPYLNDAQRAYLESLLHEQAISIEYHWRLYPKIIDMNKVVAARVQADLQYSEQKE